MKWSLGVHQTTSWFLTAGIRGSGSVQLVTSHDLFQHGFRHGHDQTVTCTLPDGTFTSQMRRPQGGRVRSELELLCGISHALSLCAYCTSLSVYLSRSLSLALFISLFLSRSLCAHTRGTGQTDPVIISLCVKVRHKSTRQDV